MAVDAIPLRTAAAGVALNATVKYNPHLWGPDELRSIFVVRTRELQGLLDRLRATPDASVPQHVLVTGSRGMGKTTLLRRLALAVDDDPELSRRWVPVTFPEEQYTVSTLAELWRNVLDALADARERQGASTEELGRLDGEIRRVGDLSPEARESAALASLADWIRSNGRRLLLLIDSTDLLLSNLAGTAEPGAPKAAKGKKASQGTRAAKVDGGATPLWRLRGTLSHDPGIFWLGASYQALETEHAYQDAFWDFFELLELRPLQVAEMREAMLALARTFGAGRGLTGEDAEREMARTLDARPERLKALRAITGGNPRTTVMLYELFAAGGADDVHSDLRRLLDTMTPLYKARMEALSDQARKLLAHLMEHWAPISARDLGQVSGIATNTVSGQLGRLEAEGLVEKAALAGTKRAGYQASERLFNIWYLMRYASRRLRQRLTWLVEFMRLWYSGDELTELARQRASQHSEGRLCRGEQLEFSRALSLALPDGPADHFRLDWAVFRAARRTADRTRSDLGELFELDGEDREYVTADDYLPRFDALDERLALCPHLTEDIRRAWIEVVKSSLSLTLPEKERIADAAKDLTESEYRDQLRQLQEERDRWAQDHGEAATAAVRDAVLAGHFFPDCPDSKLAHNQIMGRFGESPQAMALALRLVVRKHHDAWCEKVVQHALELDSENARSRNNLGILLSKQHGRGDEAEAAYLRAAELDPKYAWPWNNLGNLLSEQPGRWGEAEAAYLRAAELNPQNVRPWGNLGRLLSQQPGRGDEAEAAYRRAVELDPQNPWLWNNLGNLLSKQPGRGDEAEAAYRRAAELDPKYAVPWNNLGLLLSRQPGRGAEAEGAYRRAAELDLQYARPWNNLGRLLSQQPARRGEAEAAYRRAAKLDPQDAAPWDNLGLLLSEHPGREKEAEAAYRRAAELDPQYARPWGNLGFLLSQQPGRGGEAEAAYRRAAELASQNAWPWGNLGFLLSQQPGRGDEAEAAYLRAAELDPKYAWPWNNLGNLLSKQPGRRGEAEAAYRRAAELDPQNPWLWNNLGNLLSEQPGRGDEAEAAYRHAADLDPPYAWPWYNLGLLLTEQPGRGGEAEAAYRRAAELDPEDADPWHNLGLLLSKQPGREKEAEAAYRRAAELDPQNAWPWHSLGLLLSEQPGRLDEAEVAYRRAAELNPSAPSPAANLARLFAAGGRRPEADVAYRQAATLAQAADEQGASAETPPLDQGFGHAHVLLQAHLWLGNRDLALQALDRLAQAAAAGDRDAFHSLQEQACECQHIGLGPALKGLMEASAWADFLQPFALALGAAALDVTGDALAGAPPELRTLAEEILAELRPASGAGEERSAQLGPRG